MNIPSLPVELTAPSASAGGGAGGDGDDGAVFGDSLARATGDHAGPPAAATLTAGTEAAGGRDADTDVATGTPDAEAADGEVADTSSHGSGPDREPAAAAVRPAVPVGMVQVAALGHTHAVAATGVEPTTEDGASGVDVAETTPDGGVAPSPAAPDAGAPGREVAAAVATAREQHRDGGEGPQGRVVAAAAHEAGGDPAVPGQQVPHAPQDALEPGAAAASVAAVPTVRGDGASPASDPVVEEGLETPVPTVDGAVATDGGAAGSPATTVAAETSAAPDAATSTGTASEPASAGSRPATDLLSAGMRSGPAQREGDENSPVAAPGAGTDDAVAGEAADPTADAEAMTVPATPSRAGEAPAGEKPTGTAITGTGASTASGAVGRDRPAMSVPGGSEPARERDTVATGARTIEARPAAEAVAAPDPTGAADPLSLGPVAAARASGPSGPSATAPMASTVAARVEAAVEALRNAPPPREATIEVEGMRLVVRLRGDVVQVNVDRAVPVTWGRELSDALASRGLQLGGGAAGEPGADGASGRSGDGHRPGGRGPAPDRAASPRRPTTARDMTASGAPDGVLL